MISFEKANAEKNVWLESYEDQMTAPEQQNDWCTCHYDKVSSSNLAIGTPSNQAAEMGTWVLLELGKERQPGTMLTTLPFSILTGEGNMGPIYPLYTSQV